jgi:hypothetical protein
MDIKIKFFVKENVVVKIIACILYESKDPNLKISWTLIKENAKELLLQMGEVGINDYLNNTKYTQYIDKARWEFENLQMKDEKRKKNQESPYYYKM